MRFATWTSMSSKSVWTRKGMKLGASIPAASSKHEGRRTRTHVEITAYSLKEHMAVLSTQCPRSPRGHDDRCSLAAHAIWPISAYYLHVHENTYCPNSMCVRQFGGLPIDGLVSAWKSLHKKSFSDVFRQTWVSWINDVAVILFDFYRVDICCQRVSVRPSVSQVGVLRRQLNKRSRKQRWTLMLPKISVKFQRVYPQWGRQIQVGYPRYGCIVGGGDTRYSV